jgi:hypothetical protein
MIILSVMETSLHYSLIFHITYGCSNFLLANNNELQYLEENTLEINNNICNKRFAVRYLFLPAIMIEFPNDGCCD